MLIGAVIAGLLIVSLFLGARRTPKAMTKVKALKALSSSARTIAVILFFRLSMLPTLEQEQ